MVCLGWYYIVYFCQKSFMVYLQLTALLIILCEAK